MLPSGDRGLALCRDLASASRDVLNLTEPYRKMLWGSDDWSSLLTAHARKLISVNATTEAANAAAELAGYCEAIVPDTSVASRLYAWAYEIHHDPAWASRCRSLARENGDSAAVAHIAALEFQETQDPFLLSVVAMSSFDAGLVSQARDYLHLARTQAPADSKLLALELVAEGDLRGMSEAIEGLQAQAQSENLCTRAAECLLLASRLARLTQDTEGWENFLVLAFEADPAGLGAYSLLETLWMENRQWEHLGRLYRARTKSAKSVEEKALMYQRAGIRMITNSASPGIGVRLLQQANMIIYQQEIEPVQRLVAMLSLLTETLANTGDAPSAVRVLAQGLARPRTDDEAMWIVNRGLALAEDDQALRRTVANFESLRNNLVGNQAVLPAAAAAVELEFGTEQQKRAANAPKPGPRLEPRSRLMADVSIEVRAEVSSAGGSKAVGITRDLSASGVFVACRINLEMGEKITLSILMPGSDQWSVREHELSGRIVRVETGVGYGISFTSLPQAFLADMRVLAARKEQAE